MSKHQNTSSFYKNHIFCCINRRDEINSRCSCGVSGAEPLIKYMKKKCKEIGIIDTRVNASMCLNRCELGPVMVIYPQGIWYHYKSEQDIDKIIKQHLQEGKIVEELVLTNDQKNL
ncbi:MAG: (2Fe-2S) ferredoxin domain-containing protein [Alphaproteobacteria bacterium]